MVKFNAKAMTVEGKKSSDGCCWTCVGGSVLPVNHRQHVDRDGTLTLTAVNRLTDEGSYACDARDSTGQGMTRSVYVSVMGYLLTLHSASQSCHS